MLHRLERSPWMVDPMAAARVRSEIARIRRWGVGAPAQPPPIEPTGLPARLSSTTAATVLRVAFRAAANEIQMCLDRLTIRGSSPGAMEIVLTIRADGTVETAQVSTRGGGNVGYPSCIEQVLQRLRFPPPDPTGPMTIRYPLRIDPG